MNSFVSHAFRHSYRLGDARQRIAVPVVFKHSEYSLDGIVFAVVGRIECQLQIHLMMRGEFHQTLQPLRADAAVLWTVVGINDEGMWRMTVFFSVGQISVSRSAMKSAVALPVVKLNQVSLVSGR